MKRSLVYGCVASVAVLALVGCEFNCKAGNLESDKTGKPTGSGAQAPAKLGLSVCSQLRGQACQNPGTSFGAEVAEMHAVLVTRDVPQGATKATVAWIAEDTGGSAPANYRIAAKELDLAPLKGAGPITISGSLTRPNKGWPKGRYRVEVAVDGRVVAAQTFTMGQ